MNSRDFILNGFHVSNSVGCRHPWTGCHTGSAATFSLAHAEITRLPILPPKTSPPTKGHPPFMGQQGDITNRTKRNYRNRPLASLDQEACFTRQETPRSQSCAAPICRKAKPSPLNTALPLIMEADRRVWENVPCGVTPEVHFHDSWKGNT